MKPKKQRSSLVISFLHSTLHTFILYRSTTGSQKVEAQFSKLLGTNFNNDKNLEEKLPKLLPGLELCSKALFLSTFTSASPFTRQQTPDWSLGCCGCHECPSISREWPWCPFTLLLFQPGHSGWSPHTHPPSFIAREDTKYQRGGAGSNPPPVTRVISLFFLWARLIHRLISALSD